MSLFGAVSAEQMRAAQIVTGLTMAAFIAIGMAPGLRRHAGRIRLLLLIAYLLAGACLVAYALLR